LLRSRWRSRNGWRGWTASRPDCGTAYIPFGAGARKCIGDRFSLTQAALALAAITARWRLTPIASRPVRPAALNATVSPHRLRMRLAARPLIAASAASKRLFKG
jgi:cytochrome P450